MVDQNMPPKNAMGEPLGINLRLELLIDMGFNVSIHASIIMKMDSGIELRVKFGDEIRDQFGHQCWDQFG